MGSPVVVKTVLQRSLRKKRPYYSQLAPCKVPVPQLYHDFFEMTLNCLNDPSESSLLKMSSTILHVRAETKPLEHRSAVTPTVAKELVDAGYTVNVERSELSIFDDQEYESTGANLVPLGSWTDAPNEHIIVGLKELPEEDFPLKHTVTHS